MSENTPEPMDAATEAGIHEQSRREKMKKLVALGVDPWGQRFDDRTLLGEIRAQKSAVQFHLESGEVIAAPDREADPSIDFRAWVAAQGKGEFKGPKVRAAGRIVLSRDTGKLRFVDIQDWTGRIQLFIGRAQVGENDWAISECFDLGDLIGVDGELRYTKMGELTIFAEKLHFLTKSIAPPPDKHKGLTDPELRHRMRYVDLQTTDGVLQRFLDRTKIVRSIRSTLTEQGFCEIEGPTLHAIAGGAAARPFTTHHNALNIDLFLRIALELHLKRLLVGGMERVFELGRVYRNEGLSPRHNPEFTMLEVYQAYGDYRSMMDLTESIICNAIRATDGKFVRPWGEKTIDFTPPFARKTYDELFAEHAGVDPSDAAAVKALAEKLGFDTAGKHPDVIKSEVFEEKVEDALVGPIFVTDYPASICPLTKRKREKPEVAERFELFVYGMEVANAYTELNDPDLQDQLFRTQLDGMAEEDSMAKMDHDFIRALKHGMPPAGGLGIGIDRLVMLLTNTASIREVILFPLLRPEQE
ncbi:lysyl-tRNA synthetase [Pirellula staleyi DSM 6068]|uniref:Lysine--tRNA ligase n=1 Tax=Pirellula staleyi (strain ATCC 27377 / DSM 6068 / ICPB 4128) TaxID=530564 RepID=D2R4I5_PIRSD|nr:lysine--tRNA ligase [Pirellula staleyi]ADB15333.1 lysyl-tRNA synthetase [Pirellula staleyi DSM 6068]